MEQNVRECKVLICLTDLCSSSFVVEAHQVRLLERETFKKLVFSAAAFTQTQCRAQQLLPSISFTSLFYMKLFLVLFSNNHISETVYSFIWS